jgi:diguanylate cyclase (GGDEF)-like protein
LGRLRDTFGDTSSVEAVTSRDEVNSDMEVVDAQDSPILDASAFREELASMLSRAKRGSRRLSVVLCLLGGPGQYDFVGRRTADPLLGRAAKALVDEKRQADVAASLGRGRFALILPETGEPGARVTAERLKAAIAAAYDSESEAPMLGIGVASFGRHGRSADALLRAAERAAKPKAIPIMSFSGLRRRDGS